MILLFSAVSFLIISCSYVSASTCQSQLPSGVDSSICDEIQSAVLILRYTVRDIDEKVKETVIVALKEARDILGSTSAATIEDVKSALSGKRRKRSTSKDIPSEVRSLADKAVENIEIAITIAEKNIRSSIALAVSDINIQNDNLKTDAVKLLRKILTKRSTVSGSEDAMIRRDLPSDVQAALGIAAGEVKKAMKEAVTTSIHEYKKIMDYFVPLLKELFQRADLKGDGVDQAEQDIEQLAIKASMGFIKFYDSFSQVSIGKTIRTVESLLQKLSVIGKANPNALGLLKSILEQETQLVSSVVETTKGPDKEIRQTVIGAAEEILKDYQTIEAMIKKNGM